MTLIQWGIQCRRIIIMLIMTYMKNKKFDFKNTRFESVEYCICVIVSFALFVFDVRRSVKECVDFVVDYSGYKFPELMINYQGGFVRRGLLGELLYQLFLIHPYSLHNAIVYSEGLIFIAFAVLSYYVFYKLKYAPIMPFVIIVGGLTWYRRDFLVMLLAFVVFYLITKYAKEHRFKHVLGAVLILVFSILIYEPSFFVICPISMLIFFLYNDKGNNLKRRILNTLLVFGLPIFTMALVCGAKGTTEQANAIWQSWEPLFDYLCVEQPTVPDAIRFLSLSESVHDVAMFHLGLNYGIGQGFSCGFNTELVVGSLLFFIGIYFLMVTTPKKIVSKRTTVLLSNMFLFQLVCLVPMFTILSCDFGRTILYVIFTSYYLVYLLEKNKLEITIPFIGFISKKVTNCISLLSNPVSLLLHFVVIVSVPFSLCGGVSVYEPLFIHYYWPIIHNAFRTLTTLL